MLVHPSRDHPSRECPPSRAPVDDIIAFQRGLILPLKPGLKRRNRPKTNKTADVWEHRPDIETADAWILRLYPGPERDLDTVSQSLA